MIAVALDFILCMVVVEGFALVVWHRRTGGGIPPRVLIPNLAAGFFLTLAARFALAQATSLLIAASLLAALLAHVADLAGRWRR